MEWRWETARQFNWFPPIKSNKFVGLVAHLPGLQEQGNGESVGQIVFGLGLALPVPGRYLPRCRRDAITAPPRHRDPGPRPIVAFKFNLRLECSSLPLAGPDR
jgi:hypothetical protein